MVPKEQVLLGVIKDRRPVPLIGADLLRHLLRTLLKMAFYWDFRIQFITPF